MKCAEIAVNVPLDKTFHYLVPEGMEARLFQRAEINFGGRKTTGFIVGFADEAEVSARLEGTTLKPLEKILDEEPIITPATVDLAQWISQFYIAPFGECLSAITPAAVRSKPYRHPFTFTGELNRLTPEQQQGFETIRASLGKESAFLVHGVTGSGKTEVYKHLVRAALEMGRSVIILIPEIALTPQTLERFYGSFGDQVAIYHSRLTPNERLGEWRRALNGEARIVIGPRSAIFAPVKDLGLIIIDEEHENSYKAQNSPRYHARQVGFYRSKLENATVVLGSATPQIETYYHALQGRFGLVKLPTRYGSADIPAVDIIDLKTAPGGNFILSEQLMKSILATLRAKKQTLLFLNRRGYSPALICKDCGHRFTCPNCDVSLTFHKREKELACHHCDYHTGVPAVCPECGNNRITEIGSGTERLEHTLSSMLPQAKVERMDLDTTRKKDSYLDILSRMKQGEIDILIGTQMIAKGHDIAGIHLVGAILPDIMLSIPDFRSTERAFILLTQVIGRAGRRETRGEAVIQTFIPEHYSIQTAALQDYPQFYEKEIGKREMFEYPPFTRLGRVVFRSHDKNKLEIFIIALRRYLEGQRNKWDGVKILGPVTCPLEKLNNQYRYHIILKSKNIAQINRVMRHVRDFYRKTKGTVKVNLELDIDPLNMV